MSRKEIYVPAIRVLAWVRGVFLLSLPTLFLAPQSYAFY